MTKVSWDNGLGYRPKKDGESGTWYRQSRQEGKVVRVTLGHWPPMTREQARARIQASPLELYLSTIAPSAWGKAHLSRLRRHPLPGSKQQTLATLDQIPGVSAKRSYWDSLRLYGKWAKQRDFIDPTEGLSAPKSGGSRDRVLSWQELKNIWQVLDKDGQSQTISTGFGNQVRVLILSAQRRTEVAKLRKSDVENGVWLNRGKGGFVNMVPVATFAPYLDNWAPTTSYSKAKLKLDKASGVYGWTLHDLRRTAASRMGELGVDPFIIERTLGHKIPGVAGVYNRWKYVPDVAQALQRWALAVEDRCKATSGSELQSRVGG